MDWKLEAARLFVFNDEPFEHIKGLRVLYLITGIKPVVTITFSWSAAPADSADDGSGGNG